VEMVTARVAQVKVERMTVKSKAGARCLRDRCLSKRCCAYLENEISNN
jgi:hypothetical protein